jgi:N-acetylglucosaminyldiphosphoundecaprenol N-acetyl-beta-D-mannosaminyltransferase
MPSDHLPGAVRLFGLDILPLTFVQSTDLLLHAAATKGPKVVVTTNVDHVVRLERDQELKSLYASADYTFADGMPVVWASRLLGTPLPERVTGADLFVALCRHSVTSGQRVFVLGGRPGQERLLQDRYAKRFPGMDVVVCCPPMNFDPEGSEAEAIVKSIRACQPDFIFVCLGFEKQERWALRHVRRLDSGVIAIDGEWGSGKSWLGENLKEMISRYGQESWGDLPRCRVLTEEHWRNKWHVTASIDDTDKKRVTWNRTKNRLIKLRMVGHQSGYVWLIQEDSEVS